MNRYFYLLYRNFLIILVSYYYFDRFSIKILHLVNIYLAFAMFCNYYLNKRKVDL